MTRLKNLHKLWVLWRGWTALELASSLEYRFDFLLRVIAMTIFGVTGPIITTLIYSVSSGVPGWTFEQFLLLTGTFVLVLGLDQLFFISLTWKIIDKVRHGRFDIDLVKPVNPLGFATATAIDFEGIPRVLVGCAVVGWSLWHMGSILSFTNFAAYFFIILLALLFKYSINIIVAALAFLIVKSHTILNIFENIIDIGRNPLTIYGSIGMLLFTFFLPVGLIAFYPASAMLGLLSIGKIFALAITTFAFFAVSLYLWNIGIRKYQSAGG